MRNRAGYCIIKYVAIIFALLAALLLCAMKQRITPIDPHSGQVYIFDGTEWVWITPLEGVPTNPFGRKDFDLSDGVNYVGSGYVCTRGVDVSEHQGNIDWKKVKDSGIDYAIIRVGRRGSSKGVLYEDDYYKQNITGALDAGLDVGIYFFSQAITVEEAKQEANYALEMASPYRITMPIYFDWETLPGNDNRTDNLSGAMLTECAIAFCDVIKDAGYIPGIYFNQHQGYYKLDISRLQSYDLWIADYEGWPDFYYAIDSMQYSDNGTVPGISDGCDMDLHFEPIK